MATRNQWSSPAFPGGQGSSSFQEGQLIPEQSFVAIQNLDTIEEWHKQQRIQVEKISDQLRLELLESRSRLYGNDEEQYRGVEADEDSPRGPEAAIALQESMKSMREQLEIRRQRVEGINVLLRRRSELLAEKGGGGGSGSGSGSGKAAALAEERIASAERWMLEGASYLSVLLRAMERRLILRSEVESLEPPTDESFCIGQRPTAAPVHQEESGTDIPSGKPPSSAKKLRKKKSRASEAVKARPRAEAAPTTGQQTKPLASEAVKSRPRAEAAPTTGKQTKPLASEAVKTRPRAEAAPTTGQQTKPLASEAVKSRPRAVAAPTTGKQTKPLASEAVKTRPRPEGARTTVQQTKPVAAEAVKARPDAEAAPMMVQLTNTFASEAVKARPRAEGAPTTVQQTKPLTAGAVKARPDAEAPPTVQQTKTLVSEAVYVKPQAEAAPVPQEESDTKTLGTQSSAAAPVRQEESPGNPQTPGTTTQGTQLLASETVDVKPLAATIPVPQEDTETRVPGPQSSVTTTVQETEDLAPSYESVFSFHPERNRRTVANLKQIHAWYANERLRLAGIRSSLVSELQGAQGHDDQEGTDNEQRRPQEESPAKPSSDQRPEECLDGILGQQMILRQEWALIDELLCERSETKAVQKSSEQDTAVPEGDDLAASAQRWMEEITSYFQVLVRVLLRRCLLKAELEFLESPVDEEGACSQEGPAVLGERTA